MGDLINQIQNLPPEIRENFLKQFTKVQLRRRQLQGWGRVNELIRTSPKCPHEGRMVISRYCPSCKKIEHNNRGCNKCTTSEILEADLYIYIEEPEYIYIMKRVCKTCKIREIQNETSAAA